MDDSSCAQSLRLLDNAAISLIYEIPTGTIRRWASEDRWTPHGTRQRQLWDFAEVRRSHDRRHPPVDVSERVSGSPTQPRRCTAQSDNGGFCDRFSIPDAPFPICVRHASRIYAFIRDRTSDPASVLDAMVSSLDRASQEKVSMIRQASPDQCVVYYVQIGDLIKIGTTQNLRARLAGYPPNRRLLGSEPGGYELEQQRLVEFTAHRLCGEWFHPSAAITAHVTALRRRSHEIHSTSA